MLSFLLPFFFSFFLSLSLSFILPPSHTGICSTNKKEEERGSNSRFHTDTILFSKLSLLSSPLLFSPIIFLFLSSPLLFSSLLSYSSSALQLLTYYDFLLKIFSITSSPLLYLLSTNPSRKNISGPERGNELTRSDWLLTATICNNIQKGTHQ